MLTEQGDQMWSTGLVKAIINVDDTKYLLNQRPVGKKKMDFIVLWTD